MERVEVVLPTWMAEKYGMQIECVDRNRVGLLPVDKQSLHGVDISRAAIALHGFFFESPPFAEIFPLLSKVQWIHIAAAGIDDFASAERQRKGLWVTNVSGAYAAAMTEYAIAGMVLMTRHFGVWFNSQRDHRWPKRSGTSGRELRGKQVGIVGYGHVGRHIATACQALGMTVWATRRTPMIASGEPVDRLLPAHELAALLESSDFVILAASLNSTTKHLLGEPELRSMKPGAFIVNVARGDIVDQSALVRALRDNHIGGAVLDVATPEPLSAGDPLWDAPNLWLTPHTSGDTDEGWQRGMDLFCSNLQLFLEGHAERMGSIINLSAHL
jgi:phosphoglycerate dehydrogenase-like enzyme